MKSIRRVRAWLARVWARLFGAPAYYVGGGESLPLPLSAEEEAYLLDRFYEDRANVRRILIERNLRLVVYIARKFDNTGVGVDDLVSIGTIGLIKAINTFRPEKNIKLATYASRCIENEILMTFRSRKKSAGDVSLSDALEGDEEEGGLSLMDVVADEEDLADRIGTAELCRRLRTLIPQVLTEREAAIITMRYGLDGGEGVPQREAAERCGVSRSYVSRIEKKALEKLREALS
jgi:RNA polymerase sporulation-specific sigma factor